MPSSQRPTETERNETPEQIDGPALEQQDWDDLAGVEKPVSRPDNGDLRYPSGGIRKSGRLPGENDDNPYQGSDEALPEDVEEDALADDEATDRSAS